MNRRAFVLSALLCSSSAFAGLSTSPLVMVVEGPGTNNLTVDFVLYNANGVAVEVQTADLITFPNGEQRMRTDGFDHPAGNNPDNLVCAEVDATGVSLPAFRWGLGHPVSPIQGSFVGNIAGSWTEICTSLFDWGGIV